MRLFSALLPSAEVATALAAALPESQHWTDPANWHVTIGFYGEDDPIARAAWLRERVTGLPAPRLRLSGTGSFPGVAWLGVEHDGALDALHTAAGAPDGHPTFVPHLTVARWRGEQKPPAITHVGPWWTPDELVLFASERTATGPRYTPLDQVRLAADG